MIEFLVASWTSFILVISFCFLSLFWFFVYAGSVTGVGVKSSEKPGFAFYTSILVSIAISIFPTFIIDMSVRYYLIDLALIFGGLFVTIFSIIEYSRKK